MPYSLSRLTPGAGAARRRTRVGRGIAAGQGKTAGRGTKGQRARTGGKSGNRARSLKRITQTLPKIQGFKSLAIKPEVVNLEVIERVYAQGEIVSPATLSQKRLVRYPERGVKILGDGVFAKSLQFEKCQISAPARKKILAVGGTIR